MACDAFPLRNDLLKNACFMPLSSISFVILSFLHDAWTFPCFFVDMEDLKLFSKNQGALEADDLNLWDINLWRERLHESK